MSAKVVLMPPSPLMTVEQAKAVIQRDEDWQDILAIGYDLEGNFKVRSSQISRETTLWLAHCLIDWARNPE